jgi:4-carboxymuconolactone decarboxylase
MDRERFENGKRTRAQVLGPDYVGRNLDQADEFNRPWQELLTENTWGAVWARPGLPLKTRSFLVITILAVLGRSTELASHIRGALRNGATQEEIREVFIQAAAYAGAPVGVEAFRVATRVFAEEAGK